MLREIEPSIFVPNIQDFIFERDDVIPDHFCDYLISKFENDTEGQVKGAMGDGSFIDDGYKSTTDIELHPNKKWYDDTNVFLKKYIEPTFLEYYNTLGSIRPHLLSCKVDYDSIIFARYDIGGQFDWHFDQGSNAIGRVFQIIAYLNDTELGGETFYGVLDRKIKPKKGKVIIAPSSYPFFHKSCPVERGKKYNIIMQLSYY